MMAKIALDWGLDPVAVFNTWTRAQIGAMVEGERELAAMRKKSNGNGKRSAKSNREMMDLINGAG